MASTLHPEHSQSGLARAKSPLLASSLLIFVSAFFFQAFLESRNDEILNPDGYYHIKIASLYWTGECSVLGSDFRWTRFSSYNDLRHDWHLLYHLLLIPFTWLGLKTGAKISTVFFSALLVAVVHGVLRARRVPWAWFFSTVLLVASPHLLCRMHYPRPTIAFLSLFILLAHFILAKKGPASALLCALCLLFYNVPHNILALGGAALVILGLTERRIPRRLAAYLALGFFAGILCHPGFWVTDGSLLSPRRGAFRLWEQVQGTMATSARENRIRIGEQTVRMRLGIEFNPPRREQIFSEAALPLGVLAATFLGLLIRKRRPRAGTLLFLSLTGVYFYLYLGSRRFVEYWVPMCVLSSGLGWRDYLFAPAAPGDEDESSVSRGFRGAAWAAFCLQAAAIAWAAALPGSWFFWIPGLAGAISIALSEVFAGPRLRDKLSKTASILLLVGLLSSAWLGIGNASVAAGVLKIGDHRSARYRGAMEWLKDHSEPGDLVFHPIWDDFGPMFYFNHKNNYLVGFDPYFMFLHDQQLYLMWYLAGEGRLSPRDTVAVVRSTGARYVFSTRKGDWREFVSKLLESGELEPVFQDDFSVVLGYR